MVIIPCRKCNYSVEYLNNLLSKFPVGNHTTICTARGVITNCTGCGGGRITTHMDCIVVRHVSVGLSGRLAYASLPGKNSTRRGIPGGTHGRLGMSQP